MGRRIPNSLRDSESGGGTDLVRYPIVVDAEMLSSGDFSDLLPDNQLFSDGTTKEFTYDANGIVTFMVITYPDSVVFTYEAVYNGFGVRTNWQLI